MMILLFDFLYSVNTSGCSTPAKSITNLWLSYQLMESKGQLKHSNNTTAQKENKKELKENR
jgi:hypothetical protein